MLRNVISHFILTLALFSSLSLVFSEFYSLIYSQQNLDFIANRALLSISTAILDGMTCIEHVESPSHLKIRVVLPRSVRDCSLMLDEYGSLSLTFNGFVFRVKLPSRADLIYIPSVISQIRCGVVVVIESDGDCIYVKLFGF